MTRGVMFGPQTAQRIIDFVDASGRPSKKGLRHNPQQGLIYLTPAGGIPAASVSAGIRTPGVAKCNAMKFNDSDEIEPFIDAQTNAIASHDVYNLFKSPISGDALILVIWMYGRRCVHAEDCP